jgi:hypothetical protein
MPGQILNFCLTSACSNRFPAAQVGLHPSQALLRSTNTLKGGSSYGFRRRSALRRSDENRLRCGPHMAAHLVCEAAQQQVADAAGAKPCRCFTHRIEHTQFVDSRRSRSVLQCTSFGMILLLTSLGARAPSSAGDSIFDPEKLQYRTFMPSANPKEPLEYIQRTPGPKRSHACITGFPTKKV